MHIFITGTDTNIGKTIISSWICLHTGYTYFKPIQTGNLEGTDSNIIKQLTSSYIYKETFSYKKPKSPHLASYLEHKKISINKINFLKKNNNIIIEGAGGVLVPLNNTTLMIDLIKKSKASVIVVASSALGTINHTLLTLEALRSRNIIVLGVILNSTSNNDYKENIKAIELYGKTNVLACIPKLKKISKMELLKIKFTKHLKQIFGIK